MSPTKAMSKIEERDLPALGPESELEPGKELDQEPESGLESEPWLTGRRLGTKLATFLAVAFLVAIAPVFLIGTGQFIETSKPVERTEEQPAEEAAGDLDPPTLEIQALGIDERADSEAEETDTTVVDDTTPDDESGDGGGSQPIADADAPSIFRHYGNPQIALSLADTESGGRSISAVSLRIRFPRGGTLTDVRPFLIYRPGEAGSDSFYHKGDGGTVEFRLESDDGTSAHNPTGETLARTGNLIAAPELYKGSGPSDARVGGDEGDDGNFRKFTFIEPAQVQADTWYHLVMYNTGNDPQNNFVSSDNLNAGDRGRNPAAPLYGDLDFGVLYERGGSWTDRPEHYAIGDFYFSDGRAYGNGYMEVGDVNGAGRAANFVSPDQAVRQRFVPPEDLIVSGAHIGGMHVSGANTLTLRLVDSAGSELWSGPAEGFPSGSAGGSTSAGSAEFRGNESVPDITLRGGQEYFLVAESTGGTHTVTGLRDGSVRWNFSKDTTVVGHAELRSGGGDWQGWQLGSSAGARDEFDLSFYLTTKNCVGCS